MKHLKSFVSIFLVSILATSILATYSAFASETPCSADPTDPYAPSVVMPRGPFQGQCIDTSVKRAVQILRADENKVVIANFRYQGRFYNAHIPLKSFNKLSYVVVDLNSGLLGKLGIHVTHTELRFQTTSSILLYSQSGTQSEDPLEVNDFLMSINYMAPQGIEYNPLKGFNSDRYVSVIQFFSMQDELKIRFEGKNPLNMYEIPLQVSSADIAKILLKGFELSQKYQYSMAYDTWTSNCTNGLFDIIDQGLKLSIKPFRFNARQHQDTGLLPGFIAFDDRGLLASGQTIQSVNQTYQKPIFASSSQNYFQQWVGKNVDAARDYLEQKNSVQGLNR